jgi:hypothetical protein
MNQPPCIARKETPVRRGFVHLEGMKIGHSERTITRDSSMAVWPSLQKLSRVIALNLPEVAMPPQQ